ncbi:hypothetical protein N7478_000301 [Penicillium angulare]|uniref:uncharacterized protein n=1 Tax=Penicillium angulare TaxID=116970 RepID=UPI00253FDE9F|nr:uncharacterized protein N7478_000301 [Penicillium angulare]KAJ5291050.1 hypothetical protein N7478_000301 [Penicillium angulare]
MTSVGYEAGTVTERSEGARFDARDWGVVVRRRGRLGGWATSKAVGQVSTKDGETQGSKQQIQVSTQPNLCGSGSIARSAAESPLARDRCLENP